MARSIVCRDAGVCRQATSRGAGGASSRAPAIVEAGLGKARAGDPGGTPLCGSGRTAEHGRPAPTPPRPIRVNARATGVAQGARGVRRQSLLRTGARSGAGELRRLDQTGPSPARARDAGGNPPGTHRCPAHGRAPSSRCGGGAEAADRVHARRLAGARAGGRGGPDRAHERGRQLHAPAARFRRLRVDHRRGAPASAPPTR